jgi:hypothetical protein
MQTPPGIRIPVTTNAILLKQNDRRASGADPTRAPPGAWIGVVSALVAMLVIPTPIAVEINDFQIL